MILKKKILIKNKKQGRNNIGKITVRHRGGGKKRKIRILKNSRSLIEIKGKIKYNEYDPNRNAYISVIFYETGEKEYIIKPKSTYIGSNIIFSKHYVKNPGDSTFLYNIDIGMKIYNIEFFPYSKTKAACSGNSFAILLNKQNNKVLVLLPSKEIRLFSNKCIAFIGIPDKKKIYIKNNAGRSRLLGIRPTVRGTSMNPVDHPHGGGEGKSPIGRKYPLTPWGKKTLGLKTRKNKNLLVLKTRKI